MAIAHGAYSATSFAIEIGGQFAGWAKKVDIPKVSLQAMNAPTGSFHEVRKTGGNVELGDIKFSYNLADSPILLDWVQGVLRRNIIENDGAIVIADVNGKGRRRVNWTKGILTELKLTDLDSKEAKNPFQLETTVMPYTLAFEADSSTISAPQKNTAKQMLVSNFRFQGLGDGIDKFVTKVTWPSMKVKVAKAFYGEKLLPDLTPSGFDLGDLTIEVNSQAYAAIEKLMKKNFFARDVGDTDYLALGVEMLSTNLQKTLATVEMKFCHLMEVDQGSVEAGDKLSTFKLKLSVEEIVLKVM